MNKIQSTKPKQLSFVLRYEKDFEGVLTSALGIEIVSKTKAQRQQEIYERDEGVSSKIDVSYELLRLKVGAVEIEVVRLPYAVEMMLNGEREQDALKWRIWKAFHRAHVTLNTDLPKSCDVRALLREIVEAPELSRVKWSALSDQQTVFFYTGHTDERVVVELTGAQTSDLGNSLRVHSAAPCALFPQIKDPDDVYQNPPSEAEYLAATGLSKLADFIK